MAVKPMSLGGRPFVSGGKPVAADEDCICCGEGGDCLSCINALRAISVEISGFVDCTGSGTTKAYNNMASVLNGTWLFERGLGGCGANGWGIDVDPPLLYCASQDGVSRFYLTAICGTLRCIGNGLKLSGTEAGDNLFISNTITGPQDLSLCGLCNVPGPEIADWRLACEQGQPLERTLQCFLCNFTVSINVMTRATLVF